MRAAATLRRRAAQRGPDAGVGPGRQAATDPMPGDFTGHAFDTCEAPSQEKMDAWRTHSPYAGVGIYIAGDNRACPEQENLDPRLGRHPGRQGLAAPPARGRPAGILRPRGPLPRRTDHLRPGGRLRGGAPRRPSSPPVAGVAAAKRLGIGRRSVLWYDLEDFDVSRTHCRRSALAFVSGWTESLRDAGLPLRPVLQRRPRASTPSTPPGACPPARTRCRTTCGSPSGTAWPTPAPSTSREDGWWPHRRVKQYRGDHHERHGGARLEIDSNIVDLGGRTAAGDVRPPCRASIDFVRYHRIGRGDSGPLVGGRPVPAAAARPLRRAGLRHRFTTADPTGGASRSSASRTCPAAAGSTDAPGRRCTPTGETPLLKYGSGGNAVRRLQRALNAAGVSDLTVDGVFAAPETGRGRALPAAARPAADRRGDRGLWRQLQRGRSLTRPSACRLRSREKSLRFAGQVLLL